LLGLLLGLYSIGSFFIWIEFSREGSVSFPSIASIYLPFLTIGLIFTYVLNIINGIAVARVTESKRSLRACYFLILYPLVLLGFLLANIDEFLMTSLIFGFPFFIIGAIGLPYFAHVLKKEGIMQLTVNLVIIRCYNCFYTFELHRLEREKRCPLCGAMNRNLLTYPPDKPLEPTSKQPTTPQTPRLKTPPDEEPTKK
jgi:hypothetical protein